MLEHPSCTFNDIIEYTDKAPSTISWQLKRLKDAGIVSFRYFNKHHVLRLSNSEAVAEILYKYKVDKILDNYTDIVESL